MSILDMLTKFIPGFFTHKVSKTAVYYITCQQKIGDSENIDGTQNFP